MVIKIGITGGIGSGKSVVSRLLEMMGIPVYVSDIEAKRITHTNEVLRRELCTLVGPDVFQNGELNRPLLASYLFGDSQHAKEVNAIIHPKVKEDFRQWTPVSYTHLDVYKRQDLNELSDEDRNAFMADVARVTRAMQKAFQPEKINYGAYSDKLSHLHFHLAPKYVDGPDYGGIFQMNPGKVYLTDVEYQELIDAVKANL